MLYQSESTRTIPGHSGGFCPYTISYLTLSTINTILILGILKIKLQKQQNCLKAEGLNKLPFHTWV